MDRKEEGEVLIWRLEERDELLGVELAGSCGMRDSTAVLAGGPERPENILFMIKVSKCILIESTYL